MIEAVPLGQTEQACIGYKHIDKAIEQAKHKLKFRELNRKRKETLNLNKHSAHARQITNLGVPLQHLQEQGDPLHSSLEPPADLVAALGEINMATTQILADQFDLSNDELLNGLPLIDMSKTKFWPICPLLVKQDLRCELSRFRTMTGHCNNMKHPTWGAAMTPFARYLPPIHPDGIWTPRKSIISELTFHLSGGSPHDEAAAAGEHELASEMGLARREMAASPVAHPPEEELKSSGSVQFVRHAHTSSNLIEHHQQLGAASGGVRPGSSVSGENLVDAHYQHLRASAAAGNAAVTSASLESPAGQHVHHQHHQMATHEMIAYQPSINHVKRQHNHARSAPAELPPVRLISTVVHQDVDLPAHDFSILFMSWGQLLDHDMTRAAQPPSSIKCCGPDEPPTQAKHKLCLPIKVPEDDPFYSKFNVQCLEFRRSLAGLRPNCVLGPRVHQNAITSPIDANFVYGSSEAESQALRLFRGGRLRDRDWFKHQNLKPLLPAQEEEPDQDCLGRPKDLFCFLAGDVRVNEQIHLTVLHTLYMREHNRIADRLSELNPHWNDERIFHEARHIMAAGVQQVMINEYIPLLIGKKMASLYNLTGHSYHHDSIDHHHPLHPAPGGASYWHGYDPSVTTSVSNSFAAAAFRQGHTFIQSTVERYNKFHEFIGSEKLRHLFKQPFILYQPGALDQLTAGLINQPSQSYDPYVSKEVNGHLFQPPERQFGHDLASINLQRGREQGLPGYNLFREWCGLPRADTFDQLAPFLTNHTAFLYSRLYKHVDDIDLWSGGISERKLPGAAIGPTFACIIARQFSNTRRGDRFWFENPGFPSSFTAQQLIQIRKITLSKILCANSDDLPTIQRWALRMPHPVLNPRLDCAHLPELDLRFWQEE